MTEHRQNERVSALSFAHVVLGSTPSQKKFLRCTSEYLDRRVSIEGVDRLKGLLTALHAEAVSVARNSDAAHDLDGNPERKKAILQSMRDGMNTICDLSDEIAGLHRKPGQRGQEIMRCLSAELLA